MRYSLEQNPTVFGKILRGEIPARKVYEDDHVMAFHDIAPKAPIQVVVIPKAHLESLAHAAEAAPEELGHIFQSVAKTIEAMNIQGCRIITNCGTEQQVPHLHFILQANTDGTPLPGF